MSGCSRISQLLMEIGPAFEEIELIQAVDENAWAVVFDEETVVEVEADQSEQKLTLECTLGYLADMPRSRAGDPIDPSGKDDPDEPAEESNSVELEELCAALLSVNYLWRDTGGVRMALDGPGGNITLL